MQQGQAQFGSQITLRDPSTQQPVQTNVHGTVSYSLNGDPAQYQDYVRQAVIKAAEQVLAQKLGANQLAIPTLSMSAAALGPEIAQAAQAQMQGVQVSQLQLNINPQQAPAPQPMAPAQMPPTPMQAMQNSFQEKAQDALDPSNYEVKAKLNIGGFKVNMSSEDGLDTDGLKKQAVDKAKSKLIGCVIVAVILFIVLIGILGLGWYIYAEAKKSTVVPATPGGAPAAASDLKDADWDGKSPFNCGGNDAYRIKGVTAKLTSGTAITAGANCTLVIEDSNIEAPTGVSALGNSNITIKGGSVKGKTAALKALGNCKITVEGSKIDGKVTKLGKAVIEGAQ
ncbi:MAG: hypothetical protein H6718_31220 [Polyangiaceae bacterium]|nr:hypothetical protein [Myxococcales bacterium]MCB9589928.1 hypothetical protein [Polyangiaceae bacterium]